MAGVIASIRLILGDHCEDHIGAAGLQLDSQDLMQIEDILAWSNDFYRIIGDCGDKYRLS